MLVDVSVNYAKVGGPPDNWQDLTILYNGAVLERCIEVNCKEGWAVIYDADSKGQVKIGIDGEFATRTIHGKLDCFYTTEATVMSEKDI